MEAFGCVIACETGGRQIFLLEVSFTLVGYSDPLFESGLEMRVVAALEGDHVEHLVDRIDTAIAVDEALVQRVQHTVILVVHVFVSDLLAGAAVARRPDLVTEQLRASMNLAKPEVRMVHDGRDELIPASLADLSTSYRRLLVHTVGSLVLQLIDQLSREVLLWDHVRLHTVLQPIASL